MPDPTATITRLLRPLRTRSNALAKIPDTQSRHSTYHRALPLDVYPPPDKFASNAHFSQNYKDNLELIRKIYAVRDAFRNVLARAPSPTRLPALSSLCALVIGRNMHDWEEPPDDESESDADDFVDQMYEAVPISSRAWLLSSHALAIILNTCPHHLTLITILLDETLVHRLDHEATQLLEALLLVAFRAKPNGTPPIAHPAHAKFLTDWLERWSSAGNSTLAFTTVLIRALREFQNTHIWSSRAMENLLRRLYSLDLSSFFWAVTELAHHVSSRFQRRRQSILKDQPTDELSDLSNCLCQWLQYALDRLSNPLKDHPQDTTFSDTLFDLISTSRFILAFDTTTVALRDALVSLALVWLSRNQTTAPSTYLKSVVGILASYTPQPTTFHALVKQTLSAKTIAEGKQRIKSYSSSLRNHKLMKLEASLWGSTLFVVENLEGDNHLLPHERAEVKFYRQRVMELVDDAESNLFEGPSRDPLDILSAVEPEIKTVCQSPWSKGQWRWEPLIGSWVKQQNTVQATPSAAMGTKRRRVTFATPKKIGAISSDCPDTGPPSSRTPRPKFRPRYTPRHSTKLPPLLAPKAPSFTSLIAAAASKRTVLHPVDTNEQRKSDVVRPGCWESSPPADHKTDDRSGDHQPSDDALDLLASHSSSPTRGL